MKGSTRFIASTMLVLLALGPVYASGQAAPAGTPAPQSANRSSAYTVGATDVIKVTVFNEEKLSGAFRIDVDGTVNYPLLGRLHVAGRTVQEIEALLTSLLKDGFVNRPVVAVEIEQFRSRTIFIMGEVRTAGKYPLQGEMSLLDVLALAGSLTANASDEILIFRPKDATERQAPALPDQTSNHEVMRVSLQALQHGKLAGNVMVEDGDTVYVPKAERFYISGHVRTPGSYVLQHGMTVQQAIAVAGGLTERGSTRGIRIRREVKPSEFREVNVRMTDLVKPGDTIVIRQRLI